MSLYINNNMMAANAARNLSNIYGQLSTSVQRLSSGLRINSAADDAAGLAVRELMRADIAVIEQGVRNASDAISMIQTAEGAMSVIDEKLIRMKELAEQASTGTYTTAQRAIMNSEYQAMAAEIDRIANATDFNGVKLLDGTMAELHSGSGLKVHFGTGNDAAEDYYFVSVGDMRATEATGLQVGGGAISEVGSTWRTTVFQESDPTAAMNDGGTFGIQTSTDGTTWTLYGYVDIDTTDSLNDVAAKVSGNAATNYIDLSSAVTTDLAGHTLQINDKTWTFTTSTNLVGGNDIGLKGLSLASVALNIQYVVNYTTDTFSSVGVFARINSSVSDTTVLLMDRDMGVNTSTLSSSYTTFTLGGATFTGGGTDTSVTASVVEDPDNAGQYELQLTSTPGTQIRIIQTTGEAYDMNTSADGGTPTTIAADTDYLLSTGLGLWVGTFRNSPSTWFSEEGADSSWDGAHILTQSAAQAALAQIDSAINTKDTARANLGAIQNRLENTITNLEIQAENLQSAESRISDVDVATEMTEFTSNNILAQAATAMLAQANSLPQLALQLLG